MTATVQSAEQIVAVAETVTRFVATHPLPDNSSVSLSISNYTGNTTHPMLTGLYVTVDLHTAEAGYAAGLVARLFGADVDPDEPHRHEGDEITEWRDGTVRFDWWRPVELCASCDNELAPGDHFACADCSTDHRQDVADDRAWSEFKDSEDRR